MKNGLVTIHCYRSLTYNRLNLEISE